MNGVRSYRRALIRVALASALATLLQPAAAETLPTLAPDRTGVGINGGVGHDEPNEKRAELAPVAGRQQQAQAGTVLPSDRPAQDGGGDEAQREQLLQKLLAFVIYDYLGQGMADYVGEASIYAPEVVYYDKGRVSRAAIVADQRAYYRKWPKRTYDLIRDSFNFADAEGGTLDVTFRYTFELSNGRRTTSGTGTTTLGIALRDGAFEIVRENGRTLKPASRR